MATKRRLGELQRAVFQVLYDEPDGLPNGDVLARAEKHAPPTPAEAEDYPNHPGVRRWDRVVRFSTITSVKAGWLVKDGGKWRLTDAGRAAYDSMPDPEEFQREAIRLYHDWKAAQPKDEQPEDENEHVLGSTGVRRGWLVRGENVLGNDLVPDWLAGGWCSLAAPQLREVPAGVTRALLAHWVADDYPDLSAAERSSIVRSIYRFLTTMSVGDVVVTVRGDDVYVGEVVGEPEWVESPGSLSNRRRAVTWKNAQAPLRRHALSAQAQKLLKSRRMLHDLTTVAAEFAGLVGLDKGDLPEQPPQELVFPPVTEPVANELHLPRHFVQELADVLHERRQVVFYGPPGTGKTYVARALAHHLAGEDRTRLVQFHPSYGYEDFFQGYRPRETAEGTLAFRLVHGPFRQLVEDARKDPAHPYVLIIDEINRANLAKVFGELYFLLEYRDAAIELMYADEEEGESSFTLPENVFLIGTMNTADRSIALVDAAMRRRFAFEEFTPVLGPVSEVLPRWLKRKERDDLPGRLLGELNARLGDDDLAVGPSYLMNERSATKEGLERIWRTSIRPLLEEQLYGSGRDLKELDLPALLAAVEQPAS